MDISSCLRSIPIFSKRDDAELQRFGELTREKNYPKGSVIVFEDDPGDSLYIVRDGRVTDPLIAPGNFTALTLGCLQTVEGYAGPVAADGLGFCGKNGQSRRVTDGGPAYVKLGVSPHLTLTFEGS